MTFLKNYLREIISIDILIVPTVKLKFEGRPVQGEGKIEKIPQVNGLHHVYFRKAA